MKVTFRFALVSCGILILTATRAGPSVQKASREKPVEAGATPKPVITQAESAESPYGGTQDKGTGAPGGHGPSNRIDISFDPNKSKRVTPCDSIQFIQVVQFLVNGVPVLPEEFASAYEGLTGTSIEDDPNTPEDESGTHVDRLPGRDTPYYGGDGAGTGHSTSGASGNNDTTGKMDDEPYTQAGGMLKDPGVDEVVFKFETCAYCAVGQDAGQFFECIHWQYVKTKAEFTAGTPGNSTKTGEADGPSDSFKKAVERWSEHNNFQLPSPP